MLERPPNYRRQKGNMKWVTNGGPQLLGAPVQNCLAGFVHTCYNQNWPLALKMTAFNRCKHFLSGSRNSHGVSADTLIYLAVILFYFILFYFLGVGGGGREWNCGQNDTTTQCFNFSRGIALIVDLLPDQNRSNFYVVQATSTVFGLHADNKIFKAQIEEWTRCVILSLYFCIDHVQ
jgi:hypothetical protein